MSAIAVAGWISPEDYLEAERGSPVRHEYVDGHMVFPSWNLRIPFERIYERTAAAGRKI